ncbi:MAG: riboflavin biosynthesis protein RibF [Bacteroidales bacterium]|nr:riboflavin biosynthesis protein RibF [Candidatus Cacconaster equi]
MAVAATGFFDGVHLGHKKVIDRMLSIARERGEESMIVSFWPHPRSVLQQDADRLRLLTTLEEKKRLCAGYGVDRFEIIPFSRELSRLSARDFIKGYLKEKLGVTTLILGYDHRLGHDSFASPQEMMKVVSECGVMPVRIEELSIEAGTISSTAIRRKVSEGQIEAAEEMLGYRYSLSGVVVAGNKLGRTIGFPTANMQLYEPLKLVPGGGVYAVRAYVLDQSYFGICNIGTRPTVGLGNARTIETHILDFSQDIYGLDIKIEFLTRIRDERKFASLDQLKGQLDKDKMFAESFTRGLSTI